MILCRSISIYIFGGFEVKIRIETQKAINIEVGILLSLVGAPSIFLINLSLPTDVRL